VNFERERAPIKARQYFTIYLRFLYGRSALRRLPYKISSSQDCLSIVQSGCMAKCGCFEVLFGHNLIDLVHTTAVRGLPARLSRLVARKARPEQTWIAVLGEPEFDQVLSKASQTIAQPSPGRSS